MAGTSGGRAGSRGTERARDARGRLLALPDTCVPLIHERETEGGLAGTSGNGRPASRSPAPRSRPPTTPLRPDGARGVHSDADRAAPPLGEGQP